MSKALVLRGRRREQEALDRLLGEVRAGHSRVLVLRGEAGAGKSALLDHLAGRATACQVTRAAGAESESEIAYAPLQQLCAPLLGHLDRLPEPQRAALATAFGLGAGDPPALLLVALAVLGLFAEAAADRPLVCVVDDAQWLDRMSEVVLTFVARRLDAESVALVLAARGPGALAGLPELPVEGLADADARALLDSVLSPLNPLQRAGVERLRAHVVSVTDPGPAAVPLLLAAADRLSGLDTAAARHTYLQAIGAALPAARPGDDDLRRAAEAARPVPAGADFPGLLLTGLTAWILDGPAAAAPPLRRALAAMTTDEDLGLLALAAPAAAETADLGTYQRITERAVGFARRTGALALLPAALDLRATGLLVAGRFDDAASLIDEGEAVAAATGVPGPSSAAMLLAAYRGRDRPAPIGYAQAVLHNGRGNYPAAFAAAAHPGFGLFPWTLPELVEAAARTGETAVAIEARDLLAVRAAATGTDWAAGLLALADALTGPPDRAEEHYREAVRRLTAGPTVLPALRARLLFGEWLRRANRRAEARIELRTAFAAFTGVGAEAFAERAGRELTATGETVRKRVAGAPPELTAQEGQIVRLAVAGRTNPEIGATLFLSPRTVEWHLRKVFTKLGVTSRRELATALRDR